MERRRIIERTKATLSVISVLSMLTALFSFVYAEQQIALTWYVIRTEVELPYWLEMADRFMELNPQYAVDVMNEPSGGVAKLTTMIAAGVAPDVVRGETNWMPDYAGKGWFVDLEPYVERDRAALRLHEFPKQVLDAFILDGLRYAIPQVVSGLVYNYNTDMFSAAGVSPPQSDWTWVDLVTISRRLTREDADGRITQYGLSLGRSIHHDIYAFMLQNGGDHFTPDRRVILIDQPESVEAIDFAQSLVNQHRVAGWSADFVGGQAAAQINGPWRSGHHNAIEAEARRQSCVRRRLGHLVGQQKSRRGLGAGEVSYRYGSSAHLGEKRSVLSGSSPGGGKRVLFEGRSALKRYGVRGGDQYGGSGAFFPGLV